MGTIVLLPFEVTPAMSIAALFAGYSARKLEQQAARIEECLSRLGEAEIWWRPGDASNAIGNLVLHLEGNVRQWIIAGVGGAPDIRQRDAEFAAQGGTLGSRLSQTVAEAIAVIRAESDFERRISVQGYDVSVLEAVYHVVEHFSGHTGQIILVTKALTNAPTDFYAFLAGPNHGERTP